MQVRLRETISVDRPVDDCFRYLKDFSTIEQWDPGVYRAEKLTPGAPGKGSEFELVLKIGSRRVPMRYTLTDFSENEFLLLTGTNDTLKAVDRISFRSLDGKRTEIEYVADLTLRSLPQIARPLMMPSLNRLGKKAVRGMQTALTIGSTPRSGLKSALKDHLILPAALDFTERGYLNMPNKGLSQFMDGKIVVLTGPTAGLGLAAACELSRLGAQLVLVGRDRDRLRGAAQQVLDFSGAAAESVALFEAELSLIADVERVASEIAARYEAIDVLINNAGVLLNSREVTSEGNEVSLAVNLIAPHVLTERLLPLLIKRKGRVINVASGGMYLARLRLDDMQFEKEPYNGSQAYARAKRGLVAMTEHLARHWAPYGVDFHAMHPGWAATPGVAKSLPAFNKKLEGRLRDARMGADTMVWLASAAEIEGLTGKFWFDRRPHTTAVIPGTEVSVSQTLALARWLSGDGAGAAMSV